MVKCRNNGIGRVKWGDICMGRVKEGIEGRMTSTNEILKKSYVNLLLKKLYKIYTYIKVI